MKMFLVLMMACSGAEAMEVSEALMAATGWPAPGYLGTMQADDYRGRYPGGYSPRHGVVYPLIPARGGREDEHGHDTGRPDNREDCPPAVPIPGAGWLFLSSVASLAVIKRRV